MNTNKMKAVTQPKVTKVPFYDLEIVRFLIKDGCDLDIAYAYEDLVFSEHGLFILQFVGESSQSYACWFNKECIDNDRINLFKSLTKTATLNGLELEYMGKFEISQKEDCDEIDIHFEKV